MNRPILFPLLLLLGFGACQKHSYNPAALDLSVTIDSTRGTVLSRGSDTILIHLHYFDSLDAVPLTYHLALGSKAGAGEPVEKGFQLSDPTAPNSWKEAADLSGNKVHALTVTAADSRSKTYFIELEYLIEDHVFKQQVNQLFFKGDTLYAATMAGLFVSTDHAVSFQAVTGLGNQRVNCVFARGNTIYAGVTTGLAVSVDGGQSFSTHVFAAPFNNYPYGMVNAVASERDSLCG